MPFLQPGSLLAYRVEADSTKPQLMRRIRPFAQTGIAGDAPAARRAFATFIGAATQADQRIPYSAITGSPTIPAAQVPADWDATTGAARILNKPTIPGNAEIDARIDPAARTNSLTRWTESKLPKKADEVLDAFSEGGLQPTTRVQVSAPRPAMFANIGAATADSTWALSQPDQTPANTNQWIGIRLPESARGDFANMTLFVGNDSEAESSPANIPSSAWVSLGNDAGNDYYQIQIPSYPAEADLKVLEFEKFQLLSRYIDWASLPHNVALLDQVVTGFTIQTIASISGYSAPLRLNDADGNAFDLDTEGHGIFFCELTATLATRSSQAFGFDTAGGQFLENSGTTSVNTLLALPHWVAGGNVEGQLVARIPFYNSSTLIGAFQLYLVHNINNELQYWIRWQSEGISTPGNFSVGLRAQIVFLPTGAPTGQTGGGGLDQAQVDARVIAGVKAFARAGTSDTNTRNQIAAQLALLTGNNRIDYNNLRNTPSIPAAGLNQTQVDARVVAGTKQFARAGTSDTASRNAIAGQLALLTGNNRIPASAIRDLPSGGGTTYYAYIQPVTLGLDYAGSDTYVAYGIGSDNPVSIRYRNCADVLCRRQRLVPLRGVLIASSRRPDFSRQSRLYHWEAGARKRRYNDNDSSSWNLLQRKGIRLCYRDQRRRYRVGE